MKKLLDVVSNSVESGLMLDQTVTRPQSVVKIVIVSSTSTYTTRLVVVIRNSD